jgi:hypothetical protein
MPSQYRATTRLSEPNGRKFTIQGTGNTRAEALAELQTKTALTVGVQDSAYISEPLTGAEMGDTHTGPVYSDAVLVLRNGAGEMTSVHLENIAVVYSLGEGQIKLDDPDIVAFASAYRDGRGLGGYVPFAGEYVA